MPRWVGPELLDQSHTVEGFDCGDDALNRWIAEKALHNQTEGGSRTWVVTDGDRVVAYYASSTAVVLRAGATGRARRNQPDPLPAVLLGRLAVDAKHLGERLGEALLKHFIMKSLEVAQVTGVRVLLVHAKDETAASFYRRYNFEASPIDDLTMMLLVKDIRL
ncbi:MAG: GNAT family N-acetyltransferase [Ilumatobacteraceae bacterium]